MSTSSITRPGAVIAACVLLAAEFALVAVAVGYLVVELVVEEPASMGTAVALLVIAVIAAGALAAMVIGMWRGAAWSRSAGVVWQILQFAVGLGALQGALAQPAWGWPLILASIAGIILLLSRTVSGWTQFDRQVSPHD